MGIQDHSHNKNCRKKQDLGASGRLGKPGLERLEDRLVPTANPLETQVNNFYWLGLNRAADPAGLAAHVASLEKGATPGAVAAGILGSAEHREKVVRDLYQTYLHREADPAGLGNFTRALESGMGEDQVAAAILGSKEFGASLSDEGFVRALYAKVLKRDADVGGLNSAVAALQKGISRSGLALAFLESRERSVTLAGDLYESILGRTPSLVEASAWGERLGQKNFDQSQAAAAFAGSPEGASRLAMLDNTMVSVENPQGISYLPQYFSGLEWWSQDTVRPGVRTFTQPIGKVGEAGPIILEVEFSEPVRVTGAPVIPFLLGGAQRELVYRSGSDSATLRFEYLPNAGDTAGAQGTLDGKVGEVIRLTGDASITDWAGNAVAVVEEGSTRLAVMGAYFQAIRTLTPGDLNEIIDPENKPGKFELGRFILDPQMSTDPNAKPFFQQPDKQYWQGYSLPTFRQAVNGVQAYKVYYNSVVTDRGNRPILATGLLAVPLDASGSVDMVSYQHGTVFLKQEVPSLSFDTGNVGYAGAYEGRLAVAAFGGQGNAVIAADYFGMGETSEPEGFTVKTGHQQACLDLYRAAGRFLEASGLQIGTLNLSGWSQGGLVTTQFQEKLEELGVELGKVGVAAPPSATLAMVLRVLFNQRAGSTTEVPDPQWLSLLFALTPLSYENYFKKPGFARSFIDPQYHQAAIELYERKGDLLANLAKLPSRFIDMLRPEYRDQVSFSNSELADCYRQVSAWEFAMKTPFRAYGGTQDQDFPLSVTRLPVQFQDVFNPGKARFIEVPAASHAGTFLTATADQVEWFAGRQDA